MPTVLRDSVGLMECLETGELPANCPLVTADGSSLYPNIDTKKAIITLDLLLREDEVAQTPLLVHLTTLVFENNFFKSAFSNDIYRQTFGIAMGSSFAVTAANAFSIIARETLLNRALGSKHSFILLLLSTLLIQFYTLSLH